MARHGLGGWNFEEIQFLNRGVMCKNFQEASFKNVDFPQDGLFGSQNECFRLELKVLECSGFSNDKARLQKLQYSAHWNRLFLSFQELLPGMSYRFSKKSYDQNTEAKKIAKFFEKNFSPKKCIGLSFGENKLWSSRYKYHWTRLFLSFNMSSHQLG